MPFLMSSLLTIVAQCHLISTVSALEVPDQPKIFPKNSSLTLDGTGNHTYDADYQQANNLLGDEFPFSGANGSIVLSASNASLSVKPYPRNPKDNCDGSAACSSWYPFAHTPTPEDCIAAANRFHDDTWYEQQACTYNHCTAMFVCNNIDYWPPLYLRGVVVKDEFNLITNKEAGLGCKNCGSRYFGDPNNASAPVRCRVTFNFCNILCREGPGKCGGQDGISEELAMARMNLTNGSYSRENVTNATALVEYGSANGSRVLDEESAGPRPVATPTSDALPLIGRPSIVSMDTF